VVLIVTLVEHLQIFTRAEMGYLIFVLVLKYIFISTYYVAAKATYIRLLHGKIGFLGVFSALVP